MMREVMRIFEKVSWFALSLQLHAHKICIHAELPYHYMLMHVLYSIMCIHETNAWWRCTSMYYGIPLILGVKTNFVMVCGNYSNFVDTMYFVRHATRICLKTLVNITHLRQNK
jgi:hypothetical protein